MGIEEQQEISETKEDHINQQREAFNPARLNIIKSKGELIIQYIYTFDYTIFSALLIAFTEAK